MTVIPCITGYEIGDGVPAFYLFSYATSCRSNEEARRLIRGGGACINDVPVTAEDQIVTVEDFHNNMICMSVDDGMKWYLALDPLGKTRRLPFKWRR